jgi:hypothetical protein
MLLDICSVSVSSEISLPTTAFSWGQDGPQPALGTGLPRADVCGSLLGPKVGIYVFPLVQ